MSKQIKWKAKTIGTEGPTEIKMAEDKLNELFDVNLDLESIKEEDKLKNFLEYYRDMRDRILDIFEIEMNQNNIEALKNLYSEFCFTEKIIERINFKLEAKD